MAKQNSKHVLLSILFTDVRSQDGEEDDEEEEEVIRCICNIFRDEGLMIMCEKCQVYNIYIW